MAATGWVKVTKAAPCPICGKDHACKVSQDGAVAMCKRVGSGAFQTRPGGWYLHRLGDTPASNAGTGYVGKAHRKSAEGPSFSTPMKAMMAAGNSIKAGTGPTGAWEYRGADGESVMWVARFDVPGGDKTFRPIHRVGNNWRCGDPPGMLPLFNQHRIPPTGIIFVVEGEKAADAAGGIGLAVTTSAHGSGSAAKTDWRPLAGRDVVILRDADDPGLKYANDVARLLAKLEPPARAKGLLLPGLPEGGDIVEYLAAGGTRQDIEALAAAAPFLNTADLIGGPVLACMGDVKPRKVAWLWPGRIPLGRLSLLVGRPGEGKSFLTIDMAARVTTGTPWPDGSDCPIGSVILISGEDDAGDTIRPRLDAHYADTRKVHLLSTVRRIGEDGVAREVMFTLADVVALESAIKQIRDCKLVVIDPIGSFLGGGTDAHRDNEVRGVLAPVAKVAEKYGAAVLVVAHRRKGGGDNADEMALGSRAFTGICRAVWHLSRDSDNKNRRLLLAGKNNLAREGDGLAFEIAGEPPRIIWEANAVQMNADDALVAENNGDGERSKPGPCPDTRDAAKAWLQVELADYQEHKVAALKEDAKAAGFTGFRTIERAATELKVLRERASFGGGYIWRLPKPATSPQESSTWQPGEQGKSPEKTHDSARQVPLLAKSILPGEHGGNGNGAAMALATGGRGVPK